MPEIHAPRRERLQGVLADLGADAALITSLVNVRYLTGLASSNAAFLLPADGPGVLATDARYGLAAARDGPDVELIVTRMVEQDLADTAAARGLGRLAFETHEVTVERHAALVAGTPGDLDKSTLGHPGKYTYCVAENEAESPFAPYHVEKGFAAEDSTVFVIAAEPPHSVTNHIADDPEGILDSICSAMSTIANNNAVSSGHCAVVIGPEHARTIAAKGWTRHDIRNYLHLNPGNLFRKLAFEHRYGKVYNRNLPRWYKRELDSRIPIVPESVTIGVASEGVRGYALDPGTAQALWQKSEEMVGESFA